MPSNQHTFEKMLKYCSGNGNINDFYAVQCNAIKCYVKFSLLLQPRCLGVCVGAKIFEHPVSFNNNTMVANKTFVFFFVFYWALAFLIFAHFLFGTVFVSFFSLHMKFKCWLYGWLFVLYFILNTRLKLHFHFSAFLQCYPFYSCSWFFFFFFLVTRSVWACEFSKICNPRGH